jgi:hypothetical protein
MKDLGLHAGRSGGILMDWWSEIEDSSRRIDVKLNQDFGYINSCIFALRSQKCSPTEARVHSYKYHMHNGALLNSAKRG